MWGPICYQIGEGSNLLGPNLPGPNLPRTFSAANSFTDKLHIGDWLWLKKKWLLKASLCFKGAILASLNVSWLICPISSGDGTMSIIHHCTCPNKPKSPSLASFASFYKTCEIHRKFGTSLLGMTFRKNKSEAHLLFIFLAGLFCLLTHVLKMGPHGNFRIIWEFRCNWPKKTSRQIQRKNDNIHQKKQGEVQVPWSRQAQVHFRRQIGAWTFWTLWIFWIFSTFWQLLVFADSAQTEYCFTFHSPLVS